MQTDDLLKQAGYLGVWNPKPLDTPVHREHVRHMPIVEPEPARVHQHCPVVCVRRSVGMQKDQIEVLQIGSGGTLQILEVFQAHLEKQCLRGRVI